MAAKKPEDCQHKWRPFTPYKAACATCGKRSPWLDLLAEYQHRAERAEYLRDRAIGTLAAVDRWAERRPVPLP